MKEEEEGSISKHALYISKKIPTYLPTWGDQELPFFAVVEHDAKEEGDRQTGVEEEDQGRDGGPEGVIDQDTSYGLRSNKEKYLAQE